MLQDIINLRYYFIGVFLCQFQTDIGILLSRAPSLMSVLAIEIYALKIGLSFTLNASFMPLVVESDSLATVQLLLKEEECLALKVVLVTEIRRLLLVLSSCVRFVPRTANILAHCIAYYCLCAEELCFWLGNGPPWLLDGVKEDWSLII
ncbi:unnamed protein product [Prunus armeniaca]|uniref:RNase H type-1 domain-containing protein n=1 Tax=Prunus armeniaca TaxID=36596 RepID=A0A6J5THP8_PRUAR|nr:unnamed protein product [Prunus armeniaca]